MDDCNDDLLWLILSRIERNLERKSCARVNSQWLRVEGLTRRTLKIACPRLVSRFIHRFPNVVSIEIGNGARNEDLESIARHCPNLKTLNLSLSRLWSATGIDSDNFNTDDAELEYDVLTDKGMCTVAQGLPNLERLQLKWRSSIGDKGFLCLTASCQYLAYLDLSFCKQIKDCSLKALSDICSLRTLLLTGCSGISDKGLIYLAVGSTASTLSRLEIQQCIQLSDVSMVHLTNICGLRTLNVSECGCNITDEGVQTILSSLCIKSLDMSWLGSITDATLVVAADHCPELSHLVLTGCNGITDVGIAHLGRCKGLHVLELGQCPGVTGWDFHELALGCKSLQYLSLSYCLRAWISKDVLDTLQIRNCQVVWN